MLIYRRNALMAGKRLPYDAEVEYLESTGTQYIDTGFKAGSAPGIDITFSLSTLGSQVVFGGRTDVFRGRFALFNINGGWRFDANGQPSLNIAADTSSVFQFTYGNNTATIRNTTVGTSASVSASPSSIGQYDIALFAINTAGTISLNMNGRIYACKIYQNGVLVRDFIPVRKGTVGYLYDRVSGKLFGNAGTGDFVVGPDKN